MPAQLEFELHPVYRPTEKLILDALSGAGGPRSGQACQWFSAPQLARLVQQPYGYSHIATSGNGPRLRAQLPEADVIHVLRIGLQRVRSGAIADLGVGPQIMETIPKPGDFRVQSATRVIWWITVPYSGDESLDWDRLTRSERECSQYMAFSGPPDGMACLFVPELDRAKYPEFHWSPFVGDRTFQRKLLTIG
ncbi:hypothetical protein Aph01nite_56510 [Acrocarpospora phusangensis]|uniref:Uncharacterized protein n=1 Tax=Acrocarpospora phusangensis TaxID=1070424 RepID=A0A919QEF6_9ACTN|nr:hypothetical protein Aph01nite_56510 [Acrocarpospora phusangensis]